MTFDFAQILQQLKGSPVVILLGLLVLLLSSLITISNGISILGRYYRSTIGFKRVLRGQILKLSAGVNISHFQTMLGPYTFAATRDALRKYVFVNNYSYVQAITDLEGGVVSFSVTTRRRTFNPTLTLGPYSIDGKALRVRLGKTKFAELEMSGRPSNIFSALGGRRFHYYEEYYFGNPGNYQTFIFGINDAGHVEYGQPPTFQNCQHSTDDPDVVQFRQSSVINTYTVTKPLFFAKDAGKGFRFGPDYDQVRIIDAHRTRISRRERRRLKKIFEMGPYEYLKNNPRPGMRW